MAQVDAIKESIEELAAVFHNRVAEMKRDLDKAGPSAPTPSSLAADLTAFKTFILMSLDMLQKQVQLVSKQVDFMEMRSRRKMLVFHGVKASTSQSGSEDTTGLIVDKLKLIKSSVSAAAIGRCHRLGKPKAGKSPPILVKFRNISIRDEVWFGKVALKGSGVTVGEFLTKPRHELFMAARDRFGVRNSWTWCGDVYVLDANGQRHGVTSSAQMASISVATKVPATSSPVDELVPQSSQAAAQQSKRQRRVKAQP